MFLLYQDLLCKPRIRGALIFLRKYCCHVVLAFALVFFLGDACLCLPSLYIRLQIALRASFSHVYRQSSYKRQLPVRIVMNMTHCTSLAMKFFIFDFDIYNQHRRVLLSHHSQFFMTSRGHPFFSGRVGDSKESETPEDRT